jgi:hypothetical protein
MLAWTQLAVPSPAKAPRVVKATIWPNLMITFSPKAFKRGKVVITVRNRTPQTHVFVINGVQSAAIRPRGVGRITVTFKRRAIYSATLADCGYPTKCFEANPGQGPIGNVKVT